MDPLNELRTAVELAELRLRQRRLEEEERAGRLERALVDAVVIGTLAGVGQALGVIKRAAPVVVAQAAKVTPIGRGIGTPPSAPKR